MIRIRHSFVGQQLIVLPFNIITRSLNNPLTSDLVIHSMGFFPNAKNHYIDRPNGCGENLLIYCTKGEGWYILNNEKVIVPENHFFILPAEQPHQYGASEQSPWSIYWVHFKGSKASIISDKLKGLHYIEPSEASRKDDRIIFFEELITALQLGNDEDIINYANLSLGHLLSTFLYVQTYRDVKKGVTGKQNSFFISQATHYLNENIENQLNLKEIANHFGYSESHFCRLFMKEIHFSPASYFMQLKIERACQLLQSTNLKINQIAMKLSLEDPYYFSRIFKKIKGVSPKVYRIRTKMSASD
jgi:AraC family transcriptional regulator of arabinose operon